MLINFETIIERYGLPKGIIHIGAHYLQEQAAYLKFNLANTIWIEADPNIVKNVKESGILQKEESLYNFAATDLNGTVQLNVASFDQSSSILKLGTHKVYYPTIDVVNTLEVTSKRMDAFFEEQRIQTEKYNFLNIDIQGAELLALKGFGQYLNMIDFIYVEVNEEKLYENCCLLPDMDNFLIKRGYKRVELRMTPEKWGDAFYIKQ